MQQDELASPQAFIDQLVRRREELRVLDAGCGGKLYYELPPHARLTGIDISEESARRNKRISEIIIGDLQSYPLPRKSFDIVICCDVLEHLPSPDRALRSLFEALDDDGILILELPNVLSLKGLVTKLTPHRFHVWVLRTFLKFPNAGKPGFAPFPTFLRTSIAPRQLLRFCAAHGMKPAYVDVYKGPAIEQLRQRSPLAFRFYALAVNILNAVALGRHDFGLSDMSVVLRREPRSAVVKQHTPAVIFGDAWDTKKAQHGATLPP
jgi:SAM-dependent methyltransferase